MINEADTCQKYVIPKLIDSGWDKEPHSFIEQKTFTDGRIIVTEDEIKRGKAKRADYLLRYTRDFTIAVVEAKAYHKLPEDGLQQAKDYSEILGLQFAYSTNGKGIVEFDYITGLEREIENFPTPEELWSRLQDADGLDNDTLAQRFLTRYYNIPDKSPRYYQELAINRAVKAILQCKKRILITMATGTGKTLVAFQICWKLWNSRWNPDGEYRRPKILYLSDRNILIDDPKDKIFAPFGDARWKLEHGQVQKSREMYFAIYQAIAQDKSRPGLYREYAPDFFDLIIVDECHRGSARDDSNWREILEYFEPAYQLGMTATPLREDNRDTYRYFGNPIYTYSLRQGIEDGFLAPFRVHRILTNYDATGWRPSAGEIDRYGREIPDREYRTEDFERIIALRARTKAIARHLTDFMRKTDRFAKTIVFCVDQEHAIEMRRELNNMNADLARQHPDYVCRVTSEEGQIGRGHLSCFQDIETQTPAILTTSKLLTTGVDIPTCKNIVIARVINSMTEFKQIIGRGTRVRDDYKKFYFNILDYTGSATRLFADPDFDGEPALLMEEEIDDDGNTTGRKVIKSEEDESENDGDESSDEKIPRKYYVDDGYVEITTHVVHEMDSRGHQTRTVKYADYTAEKVRTLYPTSEELREKWVNPEQRSEVISVLKDQGVDSYQLKKETQQLGADSLDLLCNLAFNIPIRTRFERAELLRKEHREFFERYNPKAKAILEELLEKYVEHGIDQFKLPDVLQVPPISNHGNVSEIVEIFGDAKKLRNAINQLQVLIYSA